MVKSRIAPSYAFHIYHKDKKASSYFHNLLASKGLAGAGAGVVPLAHEVERLASCLDEMLYVDGTDIINSLHAERMLRRLYGVEYTLSGVASRDDLKSADWTTADKLDLNKFLERHLMQPKSSMNEATAPAADLRKVRRSPPIQTQVIQTKATSSSALKMRKSPKNSVQAANDSRLSY